MTRMLIGLTLLWLGACGDDPEASPPLRFARTGLVLSTTYETSTVDAFDLDDPSRMSRNLLAAAGDATLVRAGEGAVILNRGTASNAQLLTAELTPGPQVALPDCGPHDAVELADGRFLVSCYDRADMLVVDFATQSYASGPDLADFADTDGLPDMDQMFHAGATIYLTLQRLDRGTYAALGNGWVVAIDSATLTLIDADPLTAGTQPFELALANPYTRLGRAADGRLLVGCAGDWMTGTAMGLVALDPTTGLSTVVADGTVLGGAPSEVAIGSDDVAWALVAAPNGLEVTEMRLVRFAGSATIAATSGAFTLAGLTVDAEGKAYFGNRTDGAPTGLYVAPGSGAAAGPYVTSLPPFAIVVLE